MVKQRLDGFGPHPVAGQTQQAAATGASQQGLWMIGKVLDGLCRGMIVAADHADGLDHRPQHVLMQRVKGFRVALVLQQ